MKIKILITSTIAFIVIAIYSVSKLQFEETIINAQYQMLACEDCYHLTVEKSKNGHLDGETIIPISSTLNIEELINGIALTKAPLCLQGKLYRFNWNFFKIDPAGKRFEITKELPQTACANL